MKVEEIVFLDDGIRTGILPVSKNIQKFIAAEDGTVAEREDAWENAVSHATISAAILNTLKEDVRIYDLKVLDDSGEGAPERVRTALRWCLDRRKYFIHMSIGTINYHSYQVFRREIKELVRREAVIVAAFHNWNVITFPAAEAGVIGVRKDRHAVLENNEYLCQDHIGLRAENSIVAGGEYVFTGPSGEKIHTFHANSFAAPVMAGTIIRLAEGGKIDSFSRLMEKIKRNARSKVYPEKLREELCPENEELPFVILADLGDSHLKELNTILEGKGYHTETFAEKFINDNYIPLSLYLSEEQRVNKNKTALLGKIYEPDILIFSCEAYLMEDGAADAVLREEKYGVSLSADGRTVTYKNMSELVEEIEKI